MSGTSRVGWGRVGSLPLLLLLLLTPTHPQSPTHHHPTPQRELEHELSAYQGLPPDVAGAQEALRHARSHLQARTRVFEEAVTSQLNY